jgi:phage N-6-adenine-methyltransferase
MEAVTVSRMAISITIDDQFHSLIPPLSDIERLQLEENIEIEGCRDPLVVWSKFSDAPDKAHCKECHDMVAPVVGDGNYQCPTCGYGVAPRFLESILIDGHNRFEICERNGVHYTVVELEFDSRSEVLEWIYKNQLGRRNLSPSDASEIRGRMYNGRKKTVGRPTKLDQNDPIVAETTAEAVAKETGVSAPTIKRDGKYAEAIEVVAKEVPEVREKVRSGEVTKSDVIEAAKEPEKAKEILSKPHVSNNSGNNEWYTPAEFCDAARDVMGAIDLDPASCKLANKQVKSVKFFTAEQDGLSHDWSGRVWLNPPYSQPAISDFAKKFISEWQSGRISQAVVLVNNATETAWFQHLLKEVSAVCLKSGRIKFLDETGTPANTPLQGQVFLYYGDNRDGFVAQFAQYGECL